MADAPETPDPPEPQDESPEDVARELEEDPSRNPEDERLKDLKGG